MKKILFILTALVLSFAAVSCKDAEIEVPESAISVISSELSIPGKGGEAMIVVETEESYQASVDKSWLTCSQEGYKIVLSAEANQDLQSRYATLTIKAADEKIELSIVQFGLLSSGFAPSDISTGASAAEFSFPYEYDDMISATTDADWITLGITETALTVKIAENTTQATADNMSREAQISWSLGADSGVIAVSQKNASFMKEDANWKVEYLGVQPYTFSDGSTEDVEEIQNTVTDPSISGMYGITYFSKSDFVASGSELADYIGDVVAVEYSEAIAEVIEYYAAYGYTLTFADFLYEETDFEIFDIMDAGDYYGVAIGFTEDGQLTGRYAACEFTKEGSGDNPGGEAGYNSWLGEWKDAAGSTWTISQKVKDESYTITGIEGITTLPLTAEYDADSKGLILRAQTEIGTYESSNYGTFSMGYYGLSADGYFYTPNDPSNAYAVFAGTLSSDGASASLAGGTVTAESGQVDIVKGIYIGTSTEGKYYSISSKQVTLPSTITKVGGGSGGDDGGDEGGSGSAAYNKFLGGWTVTPANTSTDAWTTTIKQKVADASFEAYGWQGWTDDWMSPAQATYSNGNIVFKGGTGTAAATNVQIDDSGDTFDIYYMSSCVIDGESYFITSGTSMYDACQGKFDSNGNIVLTGLEVQLSDGNTYTFSDYGIVALDSATSGDTAIYTFKNEAGDFPVTMKKAGSGSSLKTMGLSMKNAVKVDPSHVIKAAAVKENVTALKASNKCQVSTSVIKHLR